MFSRATPGAGTTMAPSRPQQARTRLTVFSLEPRCQGECGSQKNTGMPSARVMPACSAISEPWSQVSDRRSGAGSCSRAATSESATAPAV